MSARGGAGASQASHPPQVKRNQYIDERSERSHSNLRYPKAARANSHSRGNINDIRGRKAKTHMGNKKDLTDGDFEKMFGKDIDQYLEGSDFDLDEFDNNS